MSTLLTKDIQPEKQNIHWFDLVASKGIIGSYELLKVLDIGKITYLDKSDLAAYKKAHE